MSTWLKVSRPGLWFPPLWLYFAVLPRPLPYERLSFWLGLCFVTFPLNFVVYGWNDTMDAATDAINPRKDSYLFGARPNAAERARLPRLVVGVGVVSSGLLISATWQNGSARSALELTLVLGAVALVNWLYNNAAGGLKQRPPWELLAQAGYLLVVPISCLLNELPLPRWPAWLYLSMFAVQSHLIGEVMDVEPDRRAGRRTTTTLLGVRNSKLLILAIVFAELTVVSIWMDAWPLSLMLVAAALWLSVASMWLFRERQTYSLREMRIAGLGSNVLALLSAAYVWYSGCLAGG